MTGPRAKTRDLKSHTRHNTFSCVSFDISGSFIRFCLGSVNWRFVYINNILFASEQQLRGESDFRMESTDFPRRLNP